MEVKILVRTPKGNASGSKKTLEKIFFIMHKPVESYVNEEDNELVWVVQGSIKQILKIQNKVALFDVMVKRTFDNKMVRKFIHKYADSEDDEKKLYEMLENQTTVEVVKLATQQEIDEDTKLTWWQKVKQKWIKTPDDLIKETEVPK